LSSEEKAVKVLSDRILEEVEPQFREAFLDVAIPDGFNFEVFRRMLGTEDGEQAKAVLERLCEASFA
jgi:ATP/maltotriose-dependent transcriptional regulator MalT